MSQFDEVSNIANPTLDAELAMSITVNAKLPKTPQRHSPAAGAPDFALDSLDNKIPIGEIEPPIPAGFPDQMANGEESFKAPQCERRLHQMVTAAQKSSSPRDPHGCGPIHDPAGLRSHTSFRAHEDFRIDGNVIMFGGASLARGKSTRDLCTILTQVGARPRIIRLLEKRLATISTLMVCMSANRSNAELLSVVADLAERFSATVIGVCANQLSMHSSFLAVGPGEPRGHELDKFRERVAIVEREFRSALLTVNNLLWRAEITAGPTSHYLANQARAADLLVAASESGSHKVSGWSDFEVSDLIMRSGRPILLAPPGTTGLKLKRTLVYWKTRARRDGRSPMLSRF